MAHSVKQLANVSCLSTFPRMALSSALAPWQHLAVFACTLSLACCWLLEDDSLDCLVIFRQQVLWKDKVHAIQVSLGCLFIFQQQILGGTQDRLHATQLECRLEHTSFKHKLLRVLLRVP